MNPQSSADSLAVRCPYCTVGAEFKLMISFKDGSFVCMECSHQEHTEEPMYRCSCPRCLKLAMGLSGIAYPRSDPQTDAAHS